MKKFILLLILGIFLVSSVYAETFTPIFCNDYEFTCCGGKIDSVNSYPVTDEASWTCPNYAYKCLIQSIGNANYHWWVGSQNCQVVSYMVVSHRLQCNNEVESKSVMLPGDQAFIRGTTGGLGDVSSTLEIEIIRPQLGFCGRSGSVGEQTTCGVQVSGADGCQFNPVGGKVYTSTSSLTGQVSAPSYTVLMSSCVLAFQSSDRHICGYKEESCSSDSDCAGHQYDNKECNGRTLQTYGCTQYGTPFNEKDRGPFDGGWGSDAQQPSTSGSANFGSRCSIVNAQQVQCCGDTDCGTNYFCDKSEFTCKENVQCHQSSDCGVSTQCDWTTKTLKTPSCEDGQCKFNQINVDCCNDQNCQSGGYCSNDYKCLDSQIKSTSSGQSENQGTSSNSLMSSGSGKMRIIILGLVILVAVGVGGYYYFRKKGPVANKSPGSGVNCGSCGTLNKLGAKFCISCGKKVSNKSKAGICKSCGQSNEKWRKFCIHCGKSLMG